MKILVLSIIASLLAYNVHSQSTKKYFYNTLLELTNSSNDTINYYLLKIKVKRNGEIDKMDILFFKNDSISSRQLKNKPFMYSLTDIISDTTFEYKSNDENQLIICPFIIKKVKFIKKPNTELVFSVLDIDKMFKLLKKCYTSKCLNYRLVTPSILFSEESYY